MYIFTSALVPVDITPGITSWCEGAVHFCVRQGLNGKWKRCKIKLKTMPSLSYISYLKGFPSIVNVSGLHNHSSKSLELPMQIVQISKTKLKSFHTLTTSSFGKTSLSAKHANIRSSGASGGTCALRLNNDMNSHCKAVDSTC